MQPQNHISCHHFSVACGPPKALMLSNIIACTTDGPESRKTGHTALKQQLKLYSPQQQSLYTFIGSDPPLGGGCYPHLLLLLLLGDACILSSRDSLSSSRVQKRVDLASTWTNLIGSLTALMYRRVHLSLFLPKGSRMNVQKTEPRLSAVDAEVKEHINSGTRISFI